MNFGKIKEKARKKLKGNYLVIVCALLIYSLIGGMFFGASKLIYNENMNIFFEIIITGLLYLGLLDIVIKIAKGKKAEIVDLFKKTDLFWKSTAVTIILTAFTVLCILLEVIASKSLMVFTLYQTELNFALASFMILVGTLLCAAIAIFYIVLMLSFSQVYYVLYENEKMAVLDIFSRSMDLMEDNKIEYIVFNLTFIGWVFLGLFTFGLLYLWLAPYMMVSEYYFYDELKKAERKKKKVKKDEK